MNIKIANRLIELRRKHGYSQEELASKLNLSRQAISKWERGESSPDTDNLIMLAKLYNISIDELLDVNTNNYYDNNNNNNNNNNFYYNDNNLIYKKDDDNDEDSSITIAQIIIDAAIPLICLAIYLTLGFVYSWGWRIGWLIFLIIPLFFSLLSAIKHKSFCEFAYPILVTGIYLFIGLVFNIYHPSWIIFITIPIYYSIFGPLDKYKKNKNKQIHYN